VSELYVADMAAACERLLEYASGLNRPEPEADRQRYEAIL
jgi:uncharacterized protein with HEPN domain